MGNAGSKSGSGQKKGFCSRLKSCLMPCYNPPGIARKVSLVCILLSIIAFGVFVGGTSAFIDHLTDSIGVDLSSNTVTNFFLPFWFAVAAGGLSYICGILHITYSYQKPFSGKVLGCCATLFYLAFAFSISFPIVLSALGMFGATAFGDLEDSITGLFPVINLFEIVGIDNAILAGLVDLIAFVYESAEDGVEAIIDVVLMVTTALNPEVRMQLQIIFFGAIISLGGLVVSISLFPYYSNKKEDEKKDRKK